MIENKPKGKVYGNRAYRLMQGLLNNLDSIYNLAKHFKWSHEEIMEQTALKVYNAEHHRLPAFERGQIYGYHQALRNQLWNQMFWLLSVDGKLLTSKEVDALTALENEGPHQPDYRSPWSRVNSDLSRHVWADDQGQSLRDKSFDRKFRSK